jgi:HEAT repeats
MVRPAKAHDAPVRSPTPNSEEAKSWDFGLDLCRPFYEDKDTDVRLSALRASVKLGGDPDVFGRKSMRVLANSDPNHDVQHAAFDALTVFRTEAASQFVQELLDDAATPADIKERAQKFIARYNRFK